MTGATGDLTPAASDEPFVPAERREQAGEHGQGSVTYHQGMGASAQQGDIGEPGTERPDHAALNREAGYGSQHGLSPEDPAYQMEVQPPADAADDDRRQPRGGEPGEPRAGGDDVSDHEERF
jgi:hypothetical protein